MIWIQLGLSLMMLMLAWRAWRLTMLDRARDELFDLRDKKLREHFLKRGALADPEYRRLRDEINRMIRYLDRASLWHFLVMLHHAPAFAWIDRQRAAFVSEPKRSGTKPLGFVERSGTKLSSFGEAVLRKATEIVITYTLVTSAVAVGVFLAFVVLLVLLALGI